MCKSVFTNEEEGIQISLNHCKVNLNEVVERATLSPWLHSHDLVALTRWVYARCDGAEGIFELRYFE